MNFIMNTNVNRIFSIYAIIFLIQVLYNSAINELNDYYFYLPLFVIIFPYLILPIYSILFIKNMKNTYEKVRGDIFDISEVEEGYTAYAPNSIITYRFKFSFSDLQGNKKTLEGKSDSYPKNEDGIVEIIYNPKNSNIAYINNDNIIWAVTIKHLYIMLFFSLLSLLFHFFI